MKFWCVLFLFVVGCSPAPESMRTVDRSIPSPDGVHEAVIVTQDPGALGSVSTAIFVRPANSRALIERDRVFVAMYRPKLDAQWKSPSTLVVVFPHDTDVRSFLTKIAGIEIVQARAAKPRDFMADAELILEGTSKNGKPNHTAEPASPSRGGSS